MYRLLSCTYTCSIYAHLQQHTDRDNNLPSFSSVPFILPDKCELSDHTGWFGSRFKESDDKKKSHRDQMRSESGTSSDAWCPHTPDRVLTHNTGSLFTPSLLQLTFPLKDNITQLPTSCFWQRQYHDVSDRCYYTGTHPAEGHTFISCPRAYLGSLSIRLYR